MTTHSQINWERIEKEFEEKLLACVLSISQLDDFKLWFRSKLEEAKKETTLKQRREWYEWGYREGVEVAANVVERWHIKKGGYNTLAFHLRNKLLNPPVKQEGN